MIISSAFSFTAHPFHFTPLDKKSVASGIKLAASPLLLFGKLFLNYYKRPDDISE